MNQKKIGLFIAKCRKDKNLTQMQLAEKLNITDRAVSKWETGKSLPDASIMLELCETLEIKVNELLIGERIMENNEKNTQKLLIDLAKQKEKSDKILLNIEIIVGVICIFVLLSLCIFASYVPLKEWQRVVLIIIGFLPLLVAAPFMLKIEQKAGYYECTHCNHKYVPSYKSVFMAQHINRTRYMKCPHCHQKSWQKKVISKD